MSFDTLLNSYKYTCNCSESLIIHGKPMQTKYKAYSNVISLYSVQIDSIYYGIDAMAVKDSLVFILTNTEEAAKRIMKANLFVLKRCKYCDVENQNKCRPLMYYDLVEAVNNESMKLKIIRRDNQLAVCAECQAMQAIKRKQKKINYQSLDAIEKYIQKIKNSP